MRFVVPTLIFYEVINALRFSQRFSKNDLATAARSLSKYRFEIWRPRGKLLELMAHLSLEDDLTVYDACYIALAKRMGLKLITEDAELLTKFPGLTRAL
jgi:predicted nucleic acid-binding protein